MRNWIGGVALVLMFSWALTAKAGILQASVLEDPSGELTIEQVALPVIEQAIEPAFEPMGDTLARGYTASVFWVRLEVAAHPNRQYLRVRPPYLDHVTLYRPDPDNPSMWIAAENGDRVPLAARAVWGVSLLFALPPADATQTIYLRLQTQSSTLMNVEVLTLPAFQQLEFQTMLLQLLLIAVMLGVLIWAALDYVLSRQRIVGVFLLVQTAQIGYVLAVGGYLPLMISSVSIADTMTSLLVGITIAVTLWFHRLLAAEFEPNQWALRVLDAMIVCSLVATVAILLGQLQIGLPLNGYMVLLLMPVLLWLAFSAKRDRVPGLLALRLTYSSLALVLFFVMAPIFGIWVSFDLYVWTTTTQGLLTGLIMAAFLWCRSVALQRQSVSDQLQLARVQESLQAEQLRAADQRQFLDMLAHELKTPLGVIQLTLDSVQMSGAQQQRLHRSLDTMSAVIDRCRLSLQLDEGRLAAHTQDVDITQVVQDLVLSCKDPQRIQLQFAEQNTAQTDRQLLAVILHNLLDNAIKYSPADSDIEVTTQPCVRDGEPGVCISVQNRLTRQPAQNTDMLFEKYFRGVNATGLTGSGLGLHLSQRLASIIGARLWAELGDKEITLCLWIPH